MLLIIKKYFLLLILIVIILLNIVPTDYYLLAPGEAIDLSEKILVENGGKDANGKILLTSVTMLKANLGQFLYGIFDPGVDLVKEKERLFSEFSYEEYLDISSRMMEESQLISKIIALRKAGYNPEITGHGILVTKVDEHSPANNQLTPGDVIVKINNESVSTIEEFSDYLQKLSVGQNIKVTFLRNNSLFSTSIPIVDLSKYGENVEKKMGIGIYASTKDLECKFPLKIEINLTGIKGSSASLMIALEILNQLTENDLSNGLIIAGTGNLGIDGKISKVEGIKQKIISAIKKNADVFIVPKDNYEEAMKYSQRIKVIPIECFDELIIQLLRL